MIQKAIIELIEKYQTIIIHHHQNPDCDCIGSQLGLKYLLEATYPKKVVYAVGSHNEKTAFLGNLDIIDDSKYNNALGIIVDVGDYERVDDKRFVNSKALIKIDHHPHTVTNCDIEWVDTAYSSCCEMIIDLAINNNLTMTNKAARVLYSGILTDTGRYYYSAVLPRTFNYGAEVYKYDFDKQALYENIYFKSIKELKFKGFILDEFSSTPNGLGYMKISNDMLEKYEVSTEYAASEVNTLSDIKEIVMWIFFIEYNTLGKIRVEFRSRGPIVNTLAKQFGGGGHSLASGALVDSWEVVDNIIKVADELLGGKDETKRDTGNR